MVIRRIREHVAELNWVAVAVDLAIVVVGVFFGTQANNWNQARLEAEQSRSYRARLINELDFNSRQFRQQIAYYGQVRNHGVATLQSLQSPAPRSGRDFLIDAYQTTQIDTGAPKRFIYDEMMSAGLVDRLGGERIQNDASDYYLEIEANERTLRENFPYRTTMRTIMPYAAQKNIRDRCGDVAVSHGRRVIGYRLPTVCDVALDPSVTSVGVIRIRSQPGLAEELTRYLASLDEKLNVLNINLNRTENLKADLARPPSES